MLCNDVDDDDDDIIIIATPTSLRNITHPEQSSTDLPLESMLTVEAAIPGSSMQWLYYYYKMSCLSRLLHYHFQQLLQLTRKALHQEDYVTSIIHRDTERHGQSYTTSEATNPQ